VHEATKAGLQEVKRDMQEKEGRELIAQQEVVKYKKMCQEILNTTMQEMRKFNKMADQLLHEQFQHTNNYKELCAHMLRRDNALLK
jgi:hypothetical protein